MEANLNYSDKKIKYSVSIRKQKQQEMIQAFRQKNFNFEDSYDEEIDIFNTYSSMNIDQLLIEFQTQKTQEQYQSILIYIKKQIKSGIYPQLAFYQELNQKMQSFQQPKIINVIVKLIGCTQYQIETQDIQLEILRMFFENKLFFNLFKNNSLNLGFLKDILNNFIVDDNTWYPLLSNYMDILIHYYNLLIDNQSFSSILDQIKLITQKKISKDDKKQFYPFLTAIMFNIIISTQPLCINEIDFFDEFQDIMDDYFQVLYTLWQNDYPCLNFLNILSNISPNYYQLQSNAAFCPFIIVIQTFLTPENFYLFIDAGLKFKSRYALKVLQLIFNEDVEDIYNQIIVATDILQYVQQNIQKIQQDENMHIQTDFLNLINSMFETKIYFESQIQKIMQPYQLSLDENNLLIKFLLDLVEKKLKKKKNDIILSTLYFICSNCKNLLQNGIHYKSILKIIIDQKNEDYHIQALNVIQNFLRIGLEEQIAQNLQENLVQEYTFDIQGDFYIQSLYESNNPEVQELAGEIVNEFFVLE